MYTKRFLLTCLVFLMCGSLSAKENIGIPPVSSAGGYGTGKAEEDCNQSTAQIDLAINNIRARVLTGGDLWWDPVSSLPHYEVPRVPPGSDLPSVHSIFAGALWIGGIDQLNQLKVAAQTYRQTGNDFWPGPLDDNGTTNAETCSTFDQFWVVFSSDINDFLAKAEASEGKIPLGDIPESILNWPGRDNPHFEDFDLPANKDLAPFWDADGDEVYDPTQGDYPVIDAEVEGVFADQMIWWIFNDKGNVHTETGGEAIGLEVGALAFAFATNDEVNNMTFYKYVVDNKSTQRLDSVYFGQWVDPDLGQFNDDFVGCVIDEGVGIVYNGNAVDGEYGANPPMLGVDFFRGPKKTLNVDEDGDGELDVETLGMSAFVYYNNDRTERGNPDNASHFYGYLAGVWKDGTPFTEGGTGYGGDNPTAYMFPGDPTDPTGWSECAEDNEPADRRFLQSAGPFQLEPGAVNDIIVGVVWVREGLVYPCPSFDVFLRADKKAQALFDNSFKLKNGPDAPSVTIRELDRELIITLWNDPLVSNNAFEAYVEADPVLAKQGFPDSTFQFQGYKLYQLASPVVSPSDYNDPDLARPVAIVDLADGITKIINYSFDGNLGVLVPDLRVDASDIGIQHTFQITEDLFATGARKLVNNKKYYFSAIAYAYNAHTPYDPLVPDETAQLEPYLEGRNNIGVYTGIPHLIAPQNGGTVLGATYGDGPEITLIEGFGNGGLNTDLVPASLDAIINNGSVDNPVYAGAAGPVDIRVFDPTKLPNSEFELVVNNVMFPNIVQPNNGSVSATGANTLTYSPNGGFEGVDAFRYEITDESGNTDIGVVVVQVGNPTINDLFVFDNSANVEESKEGSIHSVDIAALANDFAPDGTTITITSVNDPRNGVVAINGETLTYTPNLNFTGPDQFRYNVSADINGTTIRRSANVYINVYEEGASSPIEAADDFVQVAGSQEIDVLANDTNTNLDGRFVSPFSTWTLTDLTTGNVYPSETNIRRPYEQAIGGWENSTLGFTVNVNQVPNPSGDTNGVVDGSISFAQSQDRWLSLITDAEGAALFNWIRSGEFIDSQDGLNNDNRDDGGDFYDPQQYYETILDGQIAPYCLVNNSNSQPLSPACTDCTGSDTGSTPPELTLANLPSVNIVYTSDKSKWTRCPVVEIGRDAAITQGKAAKNELRRSPAWDKEGSGSYAGAISGTNVSAGQTYFVAGTSASFITYTNGSGETVTVTGNQYFSPDANTTFAAQNGAQVYDAANIGMSWFPGYAIDVEKGTRLNMMFSENSFIASENGKDMIWNPTSNIFSPSQGVNNNRLRIGGEHFVYVMSSDYDQGAAIHAKLTESALMRDNGLSLAEYAVPKLEAYNQAMWVMIPTLTPGFDLLSVENGLIPSEVTIRTRVGRSYEEVSNQPLTYRFSFADFATQVNQTEVAKQAIEMVKIVPNPYYAFSIYESSQLDNEVRITNLPNRANINIFTLGGDLVRNIRSDNSGVDTSLGGNAGSENINYQIWDLKNNKGIPIASGLYLIHVEAPDLGEEITLKFFVIARPIDLDVF